MRLAMEELVNGASLRKTEKTSGVPFATARENYIRMFGQASYNSRQKLSEEKKAACLKVLEEDSSLAQVGNPEFQSYLTRDECDMLATLCEVSMDLCFPLDMDSLAGLASSIAQAAGHKDAKCGRHWQAKFLTDHPDLRKYKTTNMDAKRAAKATEQVLPLPSPSPQSIPTITTTTRMPLHTP